MRVLSTIVYFHHSFCLLKTGVLWVQQVFHSSSFFFWYFCYSACTAYEIRGHHLEKACLPFALQSKVSCCPLTDVEAEVDSD